MPATYKGGAFEQGDFVGSTSPALTISSGANLLHVIVTTADEPVSVVWSVGSEALTLVKTDTNGSSREAYHYEKQNPTAGTGTVDVDLVGAPWYQVLAVAVGDADISGDPIRGSGSRYEITPTSPDSETPTGNLTGDLLAHCWSEFGSSDTSALAVESGTTQIALSGDNIAGYKIALSNSSTIGVTYTGSPSAAGISSWVAIKGAAAASTPGANATYYNSLIGRN